VAAASVRQNVELSPSLFEAPAPGKKP
jgi:hypothetical protein